MPERVWEETERALGEAQPEVFFETLRACGALAVIFPEIDALFGVPQPPRWHPEIDTGVHVMLALRYAASARRLRRGALRRADPRSRQGRTPRQRWPSHHGHEEFGVPLIEDLCDRLKVPNAHRELAMLAARHHTLVHRALELKPATVLTLLERLRCLPPPRALRRAVARVRGGCARSHRTRAGALSAGRLSRRALAAAAAVSLNAEERRGLPGPAIGERSRRRRLAALSALRTAGQ